MSCNEVREEMVAALDGELTGETGASLRAHLDGCEACAAELRALEATRTRMDRVLAAEPPVEPRFEELWAAATAAGGRPGRRPTESRAPGRSTARRARRSAGGVGLALAAAAVLALFLYDRAPTERPGGAPAGVAAPSKRVADAGAPRRELPPELRENPDMFVDFVIVRRLEKLRQLPELVDDLEPRVGHS